MRCCEYGPWSISVTPFSVYFTMFIFAVYWKMNVLLFLARRGSTVVEQTHQKPKVTVINFILPSNLVKFSNYLSNL
jgi:hypothetical protein